MYIDRILHHQLIGQFRVVGAANQCKVGLPIFYSFIQKSHFLLIKLQFDVWIFGFKGVQDAGEAEIHLSKQ